MTMHTQRILKKGEDPFELVSETLKNREGDGNANAFYGGFLENRNQIERFNWGCHAQMRSMPGAVIVFSRFKRSEHPGENYVTAEEAKLYNQWITSKQSPWLSVLKSGMSLNKNRPEFTKDFWYQHGFIFDKLECPSNYLQSFLIASRVPKQWPMFCKRWFDLVHNHKVNPAMAFMLVSYFTPSATNLDKYKKSGLWTFHPLDRGDWAVGIGNSTEDYWQNFHSGTPVTTRLNPPYKTSCNYLSPNGVNIIWHPTTARQVHYGNKLRDLYQDKLGVYDIIYDGGWGENRKMWAATSEQMAEIGHAEEKRLGWDE